MFDPRARVWREEELQAAKDLAAVVMTEIEMRTLAQEAQQRAAEAQAEQARAEALAVRNAQLYQESQEGSRLRERLVSVVSHDLKTPLQTVLLVARQLERLAGRAGTPGLEPVRKGATRIGDAATRMNAMVNEMLDVVRMQTGQSLDLSLAPTDLVALARHVADELRQTTTTHAIEVSEVVGELRAECDVFRLERVLSNLVSNAVKYSPAEDRVLVRLREEQDSQGRWAPRGGRGPWPGDSQRGAVPHLLVVPAGPEREGSHRRHGNRAGEREARRRAAWRHADRAQPGRGGQHLHRAAPARARVAGRGTRPNPPDEQRWVTWVVHVQLAAVLLEEAGGESWLRTSAALRVGDVGLGEDEGTLGHIQVTKGAWRVGVDAGPRAFGQ